MWCSSCWSNCKAVGRQLGKPKQSRGVSSKCLYGLLGGILCDEVTTEESLGTWLLLWLERSPLLTRHFRWEQRMFNFIAVPIIHCKHFQISDIHLSRGDHSSLDWFGNLSPTVHSRTIQHSKNQCFIATIKLPLLFSCHWSLHDLFIYWIFCFY